MNDFWEYMHRKPIVSSGDAVRYWLPIAPVTPRYGHVETSELVFGSDYAKIIPDEEPHAPIYLFHRAVWGFEPAHTKEGSRWSSKQ